MPASLHILLASALLSAATQVSAQHHVGMPSRPLDSTALEWSRGISFNDLPGWQDQSMPPTPSPFDNLSPPATTWSAPLRAAACLTAAITASATDNQENGIACGAGPWSVNTRPGFRPEDNFSKRR